MMRVVAASLGAGAPGAPAIRSAVTIGAVAHRTLTAGGGVQVVAAFERSAYLAGAGGALVCVGGASLGAGPLSVRCAGSWPGRAIAAGARGSCSASVLLVGGLRLEWGAAAPWRPPRTRATVASVAAAFAPIVSVIAERLDARPSRTGALDARAVAALASASAGLAPLGLALLTGTAAPRDALTQAARPPLEALVDWLSGGRPDGRAVAALVGLGPGLTPSGDDVLGAALITLRAAGAGEQADALGRIVLGAAAHRTSAIARAHLSCAAAGAGSEALHDLLVAAGSGQADAIADAARTLAGLGHSSGLDMLVGVGCAALALGAAA